MDFGKRLQELRVKKARDPRNDEPLTQARLAELLDELAGLGGYEYYHVSRWEGGSHIRATDRHILTGLITVLAYCGAITEVEEADALLRAGGYTTLEHREVETINATLNRYQKCGQPRGLLGSRAHVAELPACIGREYMLKEVASNVAYRNQPYCLYSKFSPLDRSISLRELRRLLEEEDIDLIVSHVRTDELRPTSPAEFWAEALRPLDNLADPALWQEARIAIEDVKKESYEHLGELLEAVAVRRGRRFVLLIDGFDYLVEEPGFGDGTRFFTSLRPISQRAHNKDGQKINVFCFVLGNRLSAAELVANERYRKKLWSISSPFNNGLLEKELLALDDDALRAVFDRVGFEEAARHRIVQAVGHQSILLRELLSAAGKEADLEEVITGLATNSVVQSYLDAQWGLLTRTGQTILLALTIAGMKSRAVLPEQLLLVIGKHSALDTVQELAQYGLVRKRVGDATSPIVVCDRDGQSWMIGYELLGRYIRHNVLCDPREKLKYEQWIGYPAEGQWLTYKEWQALTANLADYCR